MFIVFVVAFSIVTGGLFGDSGSGEMMCCCLCLWFGGFGIIRGGEHNFCRFWSDWVGFRSREFSENGLNKSYFRFVARLGLVG